MKKTIFKLGLVGGMMAVPMLSFADGKTLREIIIIIIGYFSVFMTLIIGLAVLTFIWNVYLYFFKADAENKKEAGMYVLYSVIGFFVILSMWGLVNILTNTFQLDNKMPNFPFANPVNTQGIPVQGGQNSGGIPVTGGQNSGNYIDTFGNSHTLNP